MCWRRIVKFRVFSFSYSFFSFLEGSGFYLFYILLEREVFGMGLFFIIFRSFGFFLLGLGLVGICYSCWGD